MKVVLIWARVPLEINLSAPLGICYIAAYIRSELNVNVEIIDANQERLSVEETLKRILKKNYDVVGISFMTPQADYAYELSKKIKQANEKIYIVHGGVHPTLCPTDSLNNYADFCVIGEGEITFKELLETIMKEEERANVDGLAYKVNDEIKFTKPRQFVQNLDEIPSPAFDLLPIKKYKEDIHVRKGLAIPIMASRGCPFNCTFCASPALWRRKVRYRSAHNILDEIEKYIKEYNIRKFHFYDDNFLLSEKRMIEFCETVEKRGLDFEWICLGRADTINRYPEVLTKMKQAGCAGLEIGVETLDENVLSSTNKKITASESLIALRHILDSGLEIACLQLMTFNVGETIFGHYFQNRKLVEITGKKKVFFGQFATPFPGTRFGESAANDGVVLVEKWQDYLTTNVNFVPKTLLNERPETTLRKLRISDSIIILKEYSKLEKFGVYDIKTIIENIKRIQFFFNKCNGINTIENICKYMAKRFDLEYNVALVYTMKLVVIMSQLGLLKPKNMEQYPQEIVPDWQKRFYSINSNIDMNAYLFSRVFRLMAKNLAKRSFSLKRS